jgi:hypothetical protein
MEVTPEIRKARKKAIILGSISTIGLVIIVFLVIKNVRDPEEIGPVLYLAMGAYIIVFLSVLFLIKKLRKRS